MENRVVSTPRPPPLREKKLFNRRTTESKRWDATLYSIGKFILRRPPRRLYRREERRIGNLVVLGKTDASRYAPSIKSKRGESFLSRARATSLRARGDFTRGESIPDSLLVCLSPFNIQWKPYIQVFYSYHYR